MSPCKQQSSCTNHSKEVRVVDRIATLVISGLHVVQHEGDSQAKVGTKGVDDHRAPYICSLKDKDIDGLIG